MGEKIKKIKFVTHNIRYQFGFLVLLQIFLTSAILTSKIVYLLLLKVKKKNTIFVTLPS